MEADFQKVAKQILYEYKKADYLERGLAVPLKLGTYLIENEYSRVVRYVCVD